VEVYRLDKTRTRPSGSKNGITNSWRNSTKKKGGNIQI